MNEFRYLGVILDTKLSFKSHVKKISPIFNLHNFRHIRSFLTKSAALLFLHSMILSHIEYCVTRWSHTSATTIKPIELYFKKALKVFDKKQLSYHHCNILTEYNL